MNEQPHKRSTKTPQSTKANSNRTMEGIGRKMGVTVRALVLDHRSDYCVRPHFTAPEFCPDSAEILPPRKRA